MKSTKHTILGLVVLGLFTLPAGAWAQDEDAGDKDKDTSKKEVELSPVANEVSLGLYILGDDAYRYGKYSGLTDDGFYALLDFRLEKRPDWESDDTVRWRLQRLAARAGFTPAAIRLQRPGHCGSSASIPRDSHNRFSDGQTPYRATDPGLWELRPTGTSPRAPATPSAS